MKYIFVSPSYRMVGAGLVGAKLVGAKLTGVESVSGGLKGNSGCCSFGFRLSSRNMQQQHMQKKDINPVGIEAILKQKSKM